LTQPILDKLCKLTFAICMVWSYLNLVEYASVFYGQDMYEMGVIKEKMYGVYAPFWWFMIVGGTFLPFGLLFPAIRKNYTVLMILSLLLNLVMWLERWMILAPSLAHGHEPYGWGYKWPSAIEMIITLGSFGWFTLLFLAFVKIFPSVSMYEIKEMLFEHRHVSDRLVRDPRSHPEPVKP